jgi:hypothetical protein
MKSPWRIPDFLDLEYFFIQDRQLAEKEGRAALRERDRTLYLASIAPLVDEGAEVDRSWLLLCWLRERRSLEREQQGGQTLLPGRMWYELYGLFWSLFSFLALFTGASLAWSFLSYSGKQPVNVSLFFLVFVGGQLGVLVLLLLALSYRRMRGLDLRTSLLLTLVGRGLNALLFKIRKYGVGAMSESRRTQFSAALATVQTRGKGYGSLFTWPLFLLFQLFGIAFNCGVLGILLIKVASSDLAFGWQSTIQVSASFVASLVQWIAVPWSWLLGGSSYPSLAQVAGSRMVLKDGFYRLASIDLVSWWPFLCLAICVYCLLPRMLLFMVGIRGRNGALARISFQRPDHNQLLHRLLTPRLETHPKQRSEPPVQPDSIENLPHPEVEEPVPEVEQLAINGALQALIPDELFHECDRDLLAELSQQAFGYQITDTKRIHEEYSDDTDFFKTLEIDSHGKGRPLLILQEAWQPPIEEMLSFLRALRAHIGEETPMILALVGKPTVNSIFTPVSKTDLHIWQQKSASLLDPCLQITPLVET